MMAGKGKRVSIDVNSKIMHNKKAYANSKFPMVSKTVRAIPSLVTATTKASNLFKPTHPVSYSVATSDPSQSSSNSKSTNERVYQQLAVPSAIDGTGGPTRKKKRQQKLQEERILRRSNANSKIHYLAKKTHFDLEQVKSLLDMFKALSASSPMDRQKFRQLLHTTFGLNSNAMLDRIFSIFDGDHEGTVSETEWVLGLSVMLRGNLNEKIRFTYEVYDLNGDNNMGRDEIHNCLRGCFRPVAAVPNEDEDDFEEFEKEIVELALRKFDVDRDGVVQIGDFHQAVYEDPLLLQALGPCLPSIKTTKAFLALLDTNYDKFVSGLSVPGDAGWDHCRSYSSKIGVNAHHQHHRNRLNLVRPNNVVSVFERKKWNANDKK